MAWVAGRYAARSVTRNLRRSSLAVAGIAIGCVLALVMEGFNRGRDELFARAGASSGLGHLRVVPRDWPSDHDVRLRLADWRADLAAAEALPAVAAAAPRARAEVLLALGTHVTAIEMVGVDPGREPATDRFVRTIQAGRYLEPGETGAIVIGRATANRLTADVDDDLLASVVGQSGEIEGAMFRIAGIVDTGSEDLDATICQVALGDLEKLTGRAGAGEITVMIRDWRAIDRVRDALAPRVASGDEVMTWAELSPDFKGHMRQDQIMSRAITAIILVIVLLGVASAQLAAVLDRRREFAVLSALGTGAWTMIRLVLLEGTALGVAGGLIGLGVGAPVLWHWATVGLDFSRFIGSNMSVSGAFIEPVIYLDFGVWVVPYTFLVAIGATLLASLYPAAFAARIDPAAALRVAQ
jgi:ABC-type lipoprotein release transport system permease subunit